MTGDDDHAVDEGLQVCLEQEGDLQGTGTAGGLGAPGVRLGGQGGDDRRVGQTFESTAGDGVGENQASQRPAVHGEALCVL